MNMTRNTVFAAVVAVTTALAGHAAHAELITIGLSEAGVNGGAIQTVSTDAATPGSASVSPLLFGTFTVNNISGLGFPNLASPAFDTNSVNVSSANAGKLTIYITEQGLPTPLGVSNILSSFTANGVTSGFSVTESTMIDPNDGLFTGTTLASATFTAIGTSDVVTQSPILTGPFSETTMYVITAIGLGNVNDTIDIADVPEPASMAIIGSGLLGLGALRRRRA
jgi:hypothetical protein